MKSMSSKKTKEIKNTPAPSAGKQEESFLDQALRPTRWEDYIGQKSVQDNLHI